MKRHIATSVLLLLLAAFSIGGSTAAWFTAQSGTAENAFTAGTVRLSDPAVALGSPAWQAGESNTITWSFTNTGSKRAFVRVKPEVRVTHSVTVHLAIKVTAGCHTAWVEGTRIKPGDWRGQYFQYTLGAHTAQQPLVKRILAGADQQQIGVVHVWDHDNVLYIKYLLSGGNKMSETHLYAGLAEPTHNKHSQFPFKATPAPTQEFLFSTRFIYNRLETPREQILIAGLAGTSMPVSWALCASDAPYWYPPAGADGWWYYGNAGGPTELPPGGTARICFEFSVAAGFQGSIGFSLAAEAVQASHYAIDHVWPGHPWFPLKPP